MTKQDFWQNVYLTALNQILATKMSPDNAHIHAVNTANKALFEYSEVFDKE